MRYPYLRYPHVKYTVYHIPTIFEADGGGDEKLGSVCALVKGCFAA